MSLSIRLFPEVLRSLGFASIGAAYMGIGSPFNNAIRIFHLQNLTDATLLFSWNGIDDHEILPPNGFLLLDVTSNKTISTGCFFAEGVRIYVKQSGVPTSGSVYLSAYYGVEI